MRIESSFVVRMWKASIAAAVCGLILTTAGSAWAQRVLGIDVSAHQGNILALPTANPNDSNWATLHTVDNRGFAFIRSSRGGTTGYDHRQGGYPAGNATAFNLSQRYDDPYFVQNMNLATAAGLYAGPYHRSRADIIATTPNSNGIANTGTDDANHFMQMAGAYMRPGYLVPVLDFEDGDTFRTDVEMAQFALDFSNRIYEVLQIRPAIYTNGNYAQNILAGGTLAQRNALAQPASNAPSVVSPAFSTLWSARWPNQANPHSIDMQNLDPTVGFANIYGPWDDYGVTHPWQFWQYASTAKLSGYRNGTTNIDVDVSHGDYEYLKDSLVPAVWWNDSSGDWSALTNWNSGQPVVAPSGPPGVPSCGSCTTGTGQLAPIGTQVLPTPRLPGAAGTGPAVTSGVNDTVILERPNANITVTLSTGAHNIRKLYMREALNITGGSLTINYDPNYDNDFDNNPATTFPNALRSGPISAQFSGPVSLGGTGSLNVNSLQVDATQTFTLAGSSGTLTFKTIHLMPHNTTPAKIAMTGNANIDPLNNTTATIANGPGGGTSGLVDLGGATRTFNVGNGTADVDLAINVPITNGGLTKNGLGTMQLGAANTFSGPVTVNDGILRVTANNQLGTTGITTTMTVVTPGSGGVGHGGTLQLSGNVSYNLPLTIGGGGANGVSLTMPGSLGALDNLSGNNTWSGTVTLAGTGVNGTDPLENQIGARAGALHVDGVVQNATGVNATWAKTGDGDVVLGGGAANTYSGLTRLFGGRLIVEKDGALGTAGVTNGSTSNTFQNAGSTSTIAFRAPTGSSGFNYNTFEVINTNGTGSAGLGQVDNLGGDNTFAGQIAFDGPTSSGARQVSIGVASGSLNVTGGLYARGDDGLPRNLTKLGEGKLIISGDGGASTENALVVPFANSTFNVTAGTVEMRGPSLVAANLPGVTTWNVAIGSTLLAASSRFSTGTVTVTPGGQFNLTGGSTDLATLDLTGGGSFGFTGGTLQAQTILGSVINQGGALSPGSSAGSTAIVGDYTQQSAGKLEIEIGGATPTTMFDTISVTGSAVLGGLLDVSLINGFVPTPGQIFTVLTAGSVTYDGLALSGSAANSFYLLVGSSGVALQAAGLPGDYNFDGAVDAADYVVWRKGPGYLPLHYDLWRTHFGDPSGSGAGATISSVPEPTTACLFSCGLLWLSGCSRRRRTKNHRAN